MTSFHRKTISCITAILSIAVGGTIYLLFRATSLTLFVWSETMGSMDYVMELRHSIPVRLPEWIVFSLPDGLWLYSYLLIVGVIWDFNLRKAWPALSVLPAIAIVSEVLQINSIIPGTFDPGDIVAYILATAISIIQISRNYEKNKFCET